MRKLFTNLYYNNDIGRYLIHPLLNIRNKIIPKRTLLKLRFKRMLGYSLNLNQPKSYNEKLQWLKLNDRTELHVICADKFKVRDYIQEKIGKSYLIPLLYHTKDVNDIRITNLPETPFIIKTNHNSGGVYIIRDIKNHNWESVRKSLRTQLRYKYDTGKEEWHYQKIEPRILIEKLLVDDNGKIPSDFKLHCFNGQVAFIQVDSNREEEHKQNFYDCQWNPLPFHRKFGLGNHIEKPEKLEKMIALAEKLSQSFLCVRVDFYSNKGEIFFGELTFYSGSGFGQFEPQEWDFKLGEMLKLPFEK